MAKPTAQKSSVAIARLTSILATTLPTFFIRGEADLEHREPGLHEQHENGRNHDPDGVHREREVRDRRPVLGEHGAR